MEAKIFRIGNFITIHNCLQEIVELPLPENCTNENTKGILLTEEWLNKFGFISNPYEDRYEKDDFHIHCDKTKGFLDLWVTNCRLDLKYVHQLQNLFFALTGYELEIKQESSACS